LTFVKRALWKGGYEGALAPPGIDAVDADSVAKLRARVIDEAAGTGGRGGQCLLKGLTGVFYVYLYAPLAERRERIRDRELAGTDRAAAAARAATAGARPIRRDFGAEWRDPHMYNLMLCSSMGFGERGRRDPTRGGIGEGFAARVN